MRRRRCEETDAHARSAGESRARVPWHAVGCARAGPARRNAACDQALRVRQLIDDVTPLARGAAMLRMREIAGQSGQASGPRGVDTVDERSVAATSRRRVALGCARAADRHANAGARGRPREAREPRRAVGLGVTARAGRAETRIGGPRLDGTRLTRRNAVIERAAHARRASAERERGEPQPAATPGLVVRRIARIG